MVLGPKHVVGNKNKIIVETLGQLVKFVNNKEIIQEGGNVYEINIRLYL